ncbi:MAG: quinone oxidoreductase [Deltaproteobacteria bacterium]|nr:quinone oxidoreductase [Deltaproteobacteria bacterium]
MSTPSAPLRAHAIRFHEIGGPEVLRWDAIDVPPPGPGEVRLRQTAVGLNFIDTYHRTGLYALPLPSGLGSEGAGVVDAIGDGVPASYGLAVGDRVAYATGPIGSYAEARNIPASHVVPLPAGVDDRVAAAVMLKGMTAWYLAKRTHRIAPGEAVLVHAAAGGVGLILCQWAKHLGATVIGTVGSEEKAGLARAHGCDHVILYRQEDVAARVRELTNGAKLPVVYDSVGKDTFTSSLDCLRPRGLLVTFGQSSGAIPPFDPRVLAQKGSLFLTRPTLYDYVRARQELEEAARDLFHVLTSGVVKVRIDRTRPLREAADAHRDLESRRTTGSTVLLP